MGNPAIIPVILPYYNVQTDGFQAGFGHAGEILVNSDGTATYYEYGLYQPGAFTVTSSPNNQGNIRELSITTPFQFDSNGNVTQASIKSALDQVFGSSGLYQNDTGEAVGAVFTITQQQLDNTNSL